MKEAVSMNWEAECDRLRKEMECREKTHCDEKDALKYRIAELERDLMVYEQKWSVIELIFRK